ncbi:hypothetical protein EV175_001374 [Coemansia sp. RSA 1933]|nr:hypothetical protein EV175_001374 [Coemansia sp. RSA 1933]
MPRPVRKKTKTTTATVEKENIKAQVTTTHDMEEPLVETGLLTPIRTSTPRYGRRISSAHHRRLSFMSPSPGKNKRNSLTGGDNDEDEDEDDEAELGKVLSFDGLIAGMSPIKRGDAPHDELTISNELTPPAEESESEDFDLDAFVATTCKQSTMHRKTPVDLLGGPETGDTLPKRTRTQSTSPQKRTPAKKQKAAPKRKAKAATSSSPAAATTTASKKRRR